MSPIEYRINLFNILSNNKWYHRFNYVLYEYMLLVNKKQKIIPDSLNDAKNFFY